MNMADILLFADTPSAYEELACAARALGGNPVALYAGPRSGAEQITGYGANVLYFGEIPAGAIPEDAAVAYAEAIKRAGAPLVLSRASKRDALMAGRIGIRCDMPVLNDVSAVSVDGDTVQVEHMVFGGAAKRTELVGGGAIVILAAGTFPPEEVTAVGDITDQPEKVEAGPVKLVGTEEKQEETVDLSSAQYVICVGRGIGSAENVEKAKQIAHKLGGEVACTRPIAEGEGWLARSRYLGVSGATVKPQVYIGIGVSGQVQHTVGMDGSAFVVSINKDKNAPLMKHCDVGIVMDADTALDVLGTL